MPRNSDVVYPYWKIVGIGTAGKFNNDIRFVQSVVCTCIYLIINEYLNKQRV